MTPAKLALLRDELLNDPAGLGYDTMTPEQVQTALMGNNLSVTRHVPLDELQAYLMTVVQDGQPAPVWWIIKSAAGANPVAEMAYDLFSSRLKALDTSLPTVQALMAQLVAGGILAQTTADAIVAMASVSLPRGEALLGEIPSTLDIQLALLD